ncbi:MAG: EF hand [Planctomycetes bacterium ADurb.Bin126]|nr:MAG: EF hand [Planctomycetes bacterium ADurb.Bin126]HOD82659.1 hypothetical protein [Phycisphaerae bacterium]HQL75424.1 hypothetical protein [Phycisphaerae bacterium]
MKRTQLVVVLLIVAAGALRGQAQESSAPAAVDHCAGRVDPYDPTAQRNLFFTAAGVDNELTAEEFAASRGRAGLAAVFDKWERMIQFDKNNNKTLDWFEVDAYRREVRRLVLDAFDENKDGRLTGAEREAANKSLAAGKVPGLERRLAAGPSGRDAGPGSDNWEQRRAEMIKRHDKDGDGKLNETERRAALEEYRARREQEHRAEAAPFGPSEPITRYDDIKPPPDAPAGREGRGGESGEGRGGGGMFARRPGESDAERQARVDRTRERRREETIRKFDADGDGRIVGSEREALAEQARTNMEAAALQWGLRDFDGDGDGRLDEKELAEAEEYGKKIMNVGQQLRDRMMDRDGDGKISEEERRQAGEQMREAGLKLLGQAPRYMDNDGDGKISPEERKEFQTRVTSGLIRYMDEFGLKYDQNRDGRLDQAEREKVVEGMRASWSDRIAKADTDGDGRLSAEETVALMQQFGEDLGVRPVRQNE